MRKKIAYIPPIIEVIHVEMEQSIVAQSADIRPGDGTNQNVPQEELWNDGVTIDRTYQI